MTQQQQRWLVVLSMLALYFIWGSTFLAMRYALESFPPFMMAALRFLISGVLLYGYLRMRGAPRLSFQQWRSSLIIGTLMMCMGNAFVAYAEQWVASGAAAMVIATVPLWTVVFSSFWGHRSHKREWLGIAVGIVGVIVLNMDGNLRASPMGTAALFVAAASWALGSVLGKHMKTAGGAMSSASQMLAGGGVLVVVSLLHGERWTTGPAASPTLRAILAMVFLVIFGSLVAYSAYLYLLRTVRPALATSYAFVNPLVALLLGAWLVGEQVSGCQMLAMLIITISVALVLSVNHDA